MQVILSKKVKFNSIATSNNRAALMRVSEIPGNTVTTVILDTHESYLNTVFFFGLAPIE